MSHRSYFWMCESTVDKRDCVCFGDVPSGAQLSDLPNRQSNKDVNFARTCADMLITKRL